MKRQASKLWILAATLLVAGVGAAFWGAGLQRMGGAFPVPLDDVYIHFGFARSLAEGHPFEWIPGNGYSSGETSPLYAAILALGWLFGFRGRFISVFAALVAVAAVAILVRAVQRLAAPCPRWLAWIVSAFPLAVGIVDWSLFSGMEVAALVAAIACALVALDRARAPMARRHGLTREAAQWRLGAWGAALVLLRPESAVLVFVFAIVAARGVGRRSALAALFRAGLPGAIALGTLMGVNVLATGDPASAGAQLKLLSSNPYLSDVDRARTFVENLITFALKGLRPQFPLLALGLAIAGVVARRSRAIAGACLASAALWTLLVSWNGNAPYHNFRYYAPALVLVLVAAALGAAAIARVPRGGKWLAGALALATFAFAAHGVEVQVEHFTRAVANVRDQQVEVGRRLAAETPEHATILVGDAGAIPYVSERSAIDALGLGGFRRLPFARAAVHGEAATIELIERLDPQERPAYLALYPNWFTAITGRFGHEIDRVTITDNVICGGTTKAIYRADWTPLATPGALPANVVDELDVADVISEAEHAYVAPLPQGGWTSLDVLEDKSGVRRFDGGREIPHGKSERFTVRAAPADGRARLHLRVDWATEIVARIRGVDTPLAVTPETPGKWRDAVGVVDVHAGDVVELLAEGSVYRDYHVWIEDVARSTTSR